MNIEPKKLLTQELDRLKKIKHFKSLEEKVDHIGLIGEYETAIDRLKVCDQYEITAGSLIKQLPEAENMHFCYLVVNENESSNPCNWEAVLFEGRQFFLESGDLIIKR